MEKVSPTFWLPYVDRDHLKTESPVEKFTDRRLAVRHLDLTGSDTCLIGTARTQSPLPKITRPRYPHLGHSQKSAQPKCNGKASSWGNRLRDHGNPYAR